jgi:predicted RNase H-like HicB family nuclease
MQIVAIIHKETGSAYGVSFPDLPGCIAAGDTEQEALTNAAAAVAFHVEHMRDHGDIVPLPRPLDQVRADPSFADDFAGHAAVALVPYALPGKTVRINITIDEHLLAAIDRAARERGSTRSGLLGEAARRNILNQ